jgi:hypothetical protein
MTCQEYGIFNFLLTKQLDLDSILVRFEDFNETNQSHLGALINSDNKQYILCNDSLELVKEFNQTSYTYLNDVSKRKKKKEPDESITYSKMVFLDVPDVVNLVNNFNEPAGFKDFFRTG